MASRPKVHGHQRKYLVLVALAIVLTFTGVNCQDQSAENLQRRLEAERVQHERELVRVEAASTKQLESQRRGHHEELDSRRRRHETELGRVRAEVEGVEQDYSGAVLMWGSTAGALFVLILLLARERRSRRVLDRVLRLCLDRAKQRDSAET